MQDRLKRKIGTARRQKLQIALEWVSGKKDELKASQQIVRKNEIEKDVRDVVNAEANTEVLIKELTARFGTYVDKLMADTEEKLSAITERIPSGSIELNNRNHEEKIIQLFILLQQVQASSQNRTTEQLFKKFTALDIATILHLHFQAFRDNKVTTLQKKIGEQNERIRPTHPKIKKLNEALQDFFY